ncbi:unnamed protein product [Rhizoctonia solani]|uniref:Uncharacterized protein n=1 Tax=Rhizoctonia solani TaxID=456999 RepID=A0A8H3CDU8_9AGAM|nr:unnamed protein product [Rhizoctonia solani]
MAKAVPLHVKDIREQAKSASLKAVAGFSAINILNSAHAIAAAGLALEHDGDLGGALYKYSQAAILLDHILSSAEYKHEMPKSQRGVLERLREIELAQPQPPSPAVEPDARPMGSLRDRMRMLEQAGLDVGNQPQRPMKPPKPALDSAPSKPPVDAPPPLKPMPPLEPASPPSSSRGTSSIQHDLSYLNNITGTNGGGAPPSLNRALSPATQFSTLPSAPPQFSSSPSATTPIGMFGITASAPPNGSSTATMTIPPPVLPPLQTSPPAISRARSPRSMSLNIASPTNGNNIGSASPTTDTRPPVPPRLTPTSTGNSPATLAGSNSPATLGGGTPPLSRSITGDRASISSRVSTAGTSTPPLSKSALWNSPQHTGTGMNGVMSNGTGGRSIPLSPLATGESIHMGGSPLSPRAEGNGLGLGLGMPSEEQSRPPKQRSATTEAFEAAFPSIDDIEATFPSLDALESEAEMKLLKLGVPGTAPGASGTGVGPPPSLGFDFGQQSPIPRPFPNAIPDLEGAPRPASTPANGARPGISFGSAKSRPPATPTTEPEPQPQPKSDKLPKPDLPITNTITAKTLKSYLATALQILVLDVRSRDEFESRRLPVENVVCIEPIVLGRKGMSAKELQEALVLSSRNERTLFEQRNTFDLVVLTDSSSTEFKDPTTPLSLLFRIIYETEAWADEVGEFKGEDVVVAPNSDAGKRLARKPAVSGRPTAGSVSHTRAPQDVGLTGSSFTRTPITYPERAVSPPTSSGTPAHSQRPLEDMMSPPPPASAGYFEHPHHAYSGSVTLSTNRPASIDYPNH